METEKLVLRKQDIALLLGRSQKAIEQLVYKGVIPEPRKMGGIWVWHRDQVEQWLNDFFDINVVPDDEGSPNNTPRRGRGRPRKN